MCATGRHTWLVRGIWGLGWHTFDPAKKLLTAEISSLPAGKHTLEIHFANYLGNHNWPQKYAMTVTESGEIRIATTQPTTHATTEASER